MPRTKASPTDLWMCHREYARLLHLLGLPLESVMPCDGICDRVGGKGRDAEAERLDYSSAG